jgi:hypothetical protein
MTAEITLQTAALVQSESGETRLDWDHATCQVLWAEWQPRLRSFSESYSGPRNVLASTFDGVFRIYDFDTVEDRPGPDNTRILWNGRIYDTLPYAEIYVEGRVVGLEITVTAHGE